MQISNTEFERVSFTDASSLSEICELHSFGFLVEVICIDDDKFMVRFGLLADGDGRYDYSNISNIGDSYSVTADSVQCYQFDTLIAAMSCATQALASDIDTHHW